jgi:hypothetical protein
MITDPKVDKIKRRYQLMKTEKGPWDAIYDVLARYILGRRNFTSSSELRPEDYFDAYVFDDTAQNANHLMASSNVGALWPNGGTTFRLEAPPEMQNEVEETDEVKAYFQFATKTIASVMDNPRNGFLTTYEEYHIEKGALGTSAIFVEEQDEASYPVLFRCVSARDLFIDTAPNGSVDTVYIKRSMSLQDIAKEYGTSTFNDLEMKQLNEHSNSTKYEIIVAIEPRVAYDPDSQSNKEFPYSSCHVDITRSRILRESGYKDLPVFVGRFWHALNEKYGRSPGMNALPSIRELNQLRFDLIQASEKMLYPPVNVIEGSIVGNDEVDLSAKGLNVVSVSGKMGGYNGRPIEQTMDVGDPQWAFSRLTELIEIVKNHFFLDRIMDLNNENRMTLGEANIRNQLRGQSLNTIYARDEKEVMEPILERVFNICLGKGLLGVVKGSQDEENLIAEGIQPTYIPDVLVDKMINDKEVYRIRFISPAARIRQSDEKMGIQETLQLTVELFAIDNTAIDGIDIDYAIKRSAELSGAPDKMVRSAEAVAKIRKDRQAQQEQAQQAQLMQMGAATAKDAADAQSKMEA